VAALQVHRPADSEWVTVSTDPTDTSMSSPSASPKPERVQDRLRDARIGVDVGDLLVGLDVADGAYCSASASISYVLRPRVIVLSWRSNRDPGGVRILWLDRHDVGRYS